MFQAGAPCLSSAQFKIKFLLLQSIFIDNLRTNLYLESEKLLVCIVVSEDNVVFSLFRHKSLQRCVGPILVLMFLVMQCGAIQTSWNFSQNSETSLTSLAAAQPAATLASWGKGVRALQLQNTPQKHDPGYPPIVLALFFSALLLVAEHYSRSACRFPSQATPVSMRGMLPFSLAPPVCA